MSVGLSGFNGKDLNERLCGTCGTNRRRLGFGSLDDFPEPKFDIHQHPNLLSVKVIGKVLGIGEQGFDLAGVENSPSEPIYRNKTCTIIIISYIVYFMCYRVKKIGKGD